MKHANGIMFTWEDPPRDEEGFLLEVKPSGAADYRFGHARPGHHAFGMITLPDEKKATYRVRPFRFGDPSNLTHQTTGKV